MKRILSVVMLCAMLLTCVSSGAIGAFAAGETAVNMWFEHSTAKVKKTDVTPSGLDTYTVYLAKNDIQGAQFVLSSSEDMEGVSAAITDFTNGSATIRTELFWEYYAEAADNTPDAIPPLQGAFDLVAGESKAFYFKLYSTEDTPAGDYTATITVTDNSGNTLKNVTVSAHVWNFTLTEATSLRTAVFLDMSNTSNYAPKTTSTSKKATYKMYYDYLLENRLCAFTIPEKFYNAAAANYLDNPRVTTFKLLGDNKYLSDLTDLNNVMFSNLFNQYFSEYLVGEDGEPYLNESIKRDWFEKAFFYFADEPQAYVSGWTGDTAVKIMNKNAALKEALPYCNVRCVVPFHENFPIRNYNTETGEITYSDAIQFFLDNDAFGIWCTKPYAYMDNKYLELLPGTRTMNGIIAYEGNRDLFDVPEGLDWDAEYGQFIDRIKPYIASKNGEVLEWWYCAGSNGDSGTANVLITDTGVATAMLGWQMKQYDIEGWLYYHVNNWVKDEEYTTLDTGDSGKYGDGILVYPGKPLGYEDTVVGTLRLESLRDGIEDALMLDMYRDLTSEEDMQAMIRRVSNNVVVYTNDDDDFAATREFLGNEIERLINGGTPCEHEYNSVTETPAGVHTIGKVVHTCALCGDSYAELLDPVDSVVLPGDLDGDGSVSTKDSRAMKRILLNLLDETEVCFANADIDGDGSITTKDSRALKKILLTQ